MPDFTKMKSNDEKSDDVERQLRSNEDANLKIQDLLTSIEAHLRSIRSSMTFIVVIVILGIIVQSCNLILGFGR